MSLEQDYLSAESWPLSSLSQLPVGDWPQFLGLLCWETDANIISGMKSGLNRYNSAIVESVF